LERQAATQPVDYPGMTYDRALKRLYVFGARIHHGAVGIALSAIGLALVIHDRADWPFPLRDRARD
jgi:hypothetical protein